MPTYDNPGTIEKVVVEVQRYVDDVVVVDDEFIVHKYVENFNDLWVQFSDNKIEKDQHAAAKKLQKGYRDHHDNKKQKRRGRNYNEPWDGRK